MEEMEIQYQQDKLRKTIGILASVKDENDSILPELVS